MGTTPSKASPLASAFQRMATWDLKTARRVLQDYKDKDMDFGLDAQGIAELLGCDTDWADSILVAFGGSTGIINALALICGACLVSSGPALEKAGMIFDSLDFDGTEQISMDEMTIAFLCCVRGFCVMAGVGSVPSDEELETVTLQAYRDLNKGSTQSISKPEFTKWVLEFAGGTKANREVTLQNALEQFRVVPIATAPPNDLASGEEAENNAHIDLQEMETTGSGEHDGHIAGTSGSEVDDPSPEEPVTLGEGEEFHEAALSYQDISESAAGMEAPQQSSELQEPQQPIEEPSESVEPEEAAESAIQLTDTDEVVVDSQDDDHFEPASIEADEYASVPTGDDDQEEVPSSQQEIEEVQADEEHNMQATGAQEAATGEVEAQGPGELNDTHELPREQSGVLDEPASEAYEQREHDQSTEFVPDEDTLIHQETAEPLSHQESAELLAHEDNIDTDASHAIEMASPSDQQHDAYDEGGYEAPDGELFEVEADATTSVEPSSDPIGTAEVGDEEHTYCHDFAQDTSQADDAATAIDVLRSEASTEKPPASGGGDRNDQSVDMNPVVEATPSAAEVVASSAVEEAQQPSDQHDPAEDEARSFIARRIRFRRAAPTKSAAATEQRTTADGRSESPLLDKGHDGGSVPVGTESEHTQVLTPSNGSPDAEGNAAAVEELPLEQAGTGEATPSTDLNAYDTYDYQHPEVNASSGLPPPEPLELKDEIEVATMTAPSEESTVEESAAEASVEPPA